MLEFKSYVPKDPSDDGLYRIGIDVGSYLKQAGIPDLMSPKEKLVGQTIRVGKGLYKVVSWVLEDGCMTAAVKPVVEYGVLHGDLRVYRDRDFEDVRFQDILRTAGDLWKMKIEAYVQAHGERGCCVLGAGIAVHYVPKRCRNPRMRIVINPHQICMYQGSVVWEASADSIVDHLKAQGIDCWFEYGRMD